MLNRIASILSTTFIFFLVASCDLPAELKLLKKIPFGDGGDKSASWIKRSVTSHALNGVCWMGGVAILAVDGSGKLWYSADQGNSWAVLYDFSTVFGENALTSVVYDPSYPANMIVSGLSNIYVFNSAWSFVYLATNYPGYPTGTGTSRINRLFVNGGQTIAIGNYATVSVATSYPPLSGWTSIYVNTPDPEDYRGICFNGLNYIVAGFFGSIAFQTPAAVNGNWNFLQVPTQPYFTGVCYCPTLNLPTGTVVLTATNGNIYWTLDATNSLAFNPVASGTSQRLNKVIWAGSPVNLFVAVGDGGTILKSTDGTNSWTNWDIGVAIASNENLIDIEFSGSRFAVVSSLGNVFVSP